MAPPLHRRVMSRYPVRWMAAQRLLVILGKADRSQYKHEHRNDQRKQFVICHYVHLLCTGCMKRRREARRHLAALPCGKAALPAGGDPHGHSSMRKTPLSTATALRRPPFCLPERAKHRNSTRKPALRAPESLGRGRETGTAAKAVALRATPSGALRETKPPRLCQRDSFARRPPFGAPTACGARPAVPGGCFSGSCSAGAARPAFPAGWRPMRAAPCAHARPPRGRDRRRW